MGVKVEIYIKKEKCDMTTLYTIYYLLCNYRALANQLKELTIKSDCYTSPRHDVKL
ncbi:Uncharacterised protein [Escherichia coli]|nr:Uncharacterised protein [Escherichia coli]